MVSLKQFNMLKSKISNNNNKKKSGFDSHYQPFYFFLPKHLYTWYDTVLFGDNLTVKITTIKIKPHTRDVLASVGKKGQTYDDIIRMLLHHYDEGITFDNL